jgi:hypothetical protein
LTNFEHDKFDAYDREKQGKWTPVDGCDRFYVSCSGQMPVLCRINTAVVDGQTRYGVVIQYPTKFLAFPLRDLKPLIKTLQDLEKIDNKLGLVNREPAETTK